MSWKVERRRLNCGRGSTVSDLGDLTPVLVTRLWSEEVVAVACRLARCSSNYQAAMPQEETGVDRPSPIASTQPAQVWGVGAQPFGCDEAAVGSLATENATVCQGLLTNLASRGLRTDRSLLVIVDGAKALDTAVTQTFGRAALVQRCQVHKGRNILEHLPEAQRPWVKAGPHARLHEQPRQDGQASAAGPGAALGH